MQQIEEAVRQLGGVVVPKLNWSCPSDATWLSPFSNMQCANSEQVRGLAAPGGAGMAHTLLQHGMCTAPASRRLMSK